MTYKEYYDLQRKDAELLRSGAGEEELKHVRSQIASYNKDLVAHYPFLMPRSVWDDHLLEDYDYSWTYLDSMPSGWAIAFGIEMCEEIRDDLISNNFLDEYRVVQIKEKYGGLRWYDNGTPKESRICDIISKYEERSLQTCITCGAPATKVSLGWISPYCDSCAASMTYVRFVDIADYMK